MKFSFRHNESERNIKTMESSSEGT